MTSGFIALTLCWMLPSPAFGLPCKAGVSVPSIAALEQHLGAELDRAVGRYCEAGTEWCWESGGTLQLSDGRTADARIRSCHQVARYESAWTLLPLAMMGDLSRACGALDGGAWRNFSHVQDPTGSPFLAQFHLASLNLSFYASPNHQLAFFCAHQEGEAAYFGLRSLPLYVTGAFLVLGLAVSGLGLLLQIGAKRRLNETLATVGSLSKLLYERCLADQLLVDWGERHDKGEIFDHIRRAREEVKRNDQPADYDFFHWPGQQPAWLKLLEEREQRAKEAKSSTTLIYQEGSGKTPGAEDAEVARRPVGVNLCHFFPGHKLALLGLVDIAQVYDNDEKMEQYDTLLFVESAVFDAQSRASRAQSRGTSKTQRTKLQRFAAFQEAADGMKSKDAALPPRRSPIFQALNPKA